MRSSTLFLAILLILTSCSNSDSEPDAFGNFTATEILLSSETSGKVLAKLADEGDIVDSGKVVFIIDTMQNYLKIMELTAKRNSIVSKKANFNAQIDVLSEQRNALNNDLLRFRNMFAEGAASQKQIDDLNNNLKILNKQIEQVKTNFTAIEAEIASMDASIAQIRDFISRSKIKSPIRGTILETYAECGESVAPGRSLFKIADIETMELKAYFSGDQLPMISLGQEVDVMLDGGNGTLKTLNGSITWISSNAEFTPKVIQTRKERVNLVYAVKISVKNDGIIKINMPGEVKIKTKVN